MLLLVGLSVAVQPHMWTEWLTFLVEHSGDGVWRFVQIPLALVLAGYASRTNRPWLVVVAWWLSMPTATPLFMQAWGALAPIARIGGSSRFTLRGWMSESRDASTGIDHVDTRQAGAHT